MPSEASSPPTRSSRLPPRSIDLKPDTFPPGGAADAASLAVHTQDLAKRYGKTVALSGLDRKSTRLNSSHANISYAVFCLKKKNRSQELFAHMSVLTTWVLA